MNAPDLIEQINNEREKMTSRLFLVPGGMSYRQDEKPIRTLEYDVKTQINTVLDGLLSDYFNNRDLLKAKKKVLRNLTAKFELNDAMFWNKVIKIVLMSFDSQAMSLFNRIIDLREAYITNGYVLRFIALYILNDTEDLPYSLDKLLDDISIVTSEVVEP